MKRMVSILVSGLLLSGSAFAATKETQREQLANQSRERITTITRTLTVITWVGRCNDVLAGVPAGKALGAKWNPSESHWDKTVDAMLDTVMKRFDDLHNAREARARMDLPFQSDLSEEEAAEILALSSAERREIDDYADMLTLAVNLLQHRSDLKVGTPEYKKALAPLLAMSKIPEMHDPPKVKLGEKTMRDYRQARSAAVDFLRSAMDGQLQLFFNDHFDEMLAMASKAASAAGQSR